MKKRIIVLTAAISAALLVSTGCSKEGNKEPETSAVESQVELESSDEQETESTEEETQDMTAETEESEGSIGTAETETNMVKIWGTITEVTESSITVDNQYGASSQGEIVLNIDPEKTYVIDSTTYSPVSPEEIQLGRFEAYLGPAMTMSLPPQTTPYMVIVNIPEDAQVPQFVVSAGAVEETEEGKILKTTDGNSYKLAEETQILPYLTKNIVRLEDIMENSRCLLWLDSEERVEMILLFAN